ncbi:MAG TPA: glutamate--tRNA ligase [Candidatus Norongarragalinales archaeon]|nr:glutamate--tRNA ligase [Candidatus Norongarragalinales archaeon]
MVESLFDTAKKFALKNAADYGRADEKAVVGKLLAIHPEAKKDISSVIGAAKKAVADVNGMPKEEVVRQAGKHTFEKKENAGGELELPGAIKGGVVTRFPPEPNGYPHVGHAKAVLLNYDCAKKYEGKFLLRWDDTNPETEKEEFVEAIRNGLDWLGIKPDKESFVSDDLDTLYKFARNLVENSGAYACLCPQSKIKEFRAMQKECECRLRGKEDHLDLWEGMLNGRFRHNQAVLRFAGGMASPNTVMRDPVLFRIIEATHYRQKDRFSVWPTYDFDVPIEDSLGGITHAMRSKEYELRDELYFAILEKLGLRKPALIEFSRLSLRGMPISKRLLKKLIEEKKVSGWNDPRLPTLEGLKRRGIQPAAVCNFVRSFGLSKVESEPPIDRLLVENKKLLDPVACHYFLAVTPVKLHVLDSPKEISELRLRRHPVAELGERTIKVSGEFYISQADSGVLSEGEEIRLKDLYNVRVLKTGTNFVEAEYSAATGPVEKKIQWVPGSNGTAVPARLVVPSELLDENENFRPESLKIFDAFAEPECRKIAQGETVQFERVGFARLDDKEKMTFVLSTRMRE